MMAQVGLKLKFKQCLWAGVDAMGANSAQVHYAELSAPDAAGALPLHAQASACRQIGAGECSAGTV